MATATNIISRVNTISTTLRHFFVLRLFCSICLVSIISYLSFRFSILHYVFLVKRFLVFIVLPFCFTLLFVIVSTNGSTLFIAETLQNVFQFSFHVRFGSFHVRFGICLSLQFYNLSRKKDIFFIDIRYIFSSYTSIL